MAPTSPPSSPPRPLHAFTLSSPPFPFPHSITSLLAAPSPFGSLALFLSDSTALLYPSVHFDSPQVPFITLPSPSLPSLSTFSLLQPSNTLLFFSFTASNPIAYHLSSNKFTPVPVQFKPDLFSPLLPFGLGFRVKSSHNILAIHSIGASQIWLLFVNLRANGEFMVELKKCAVIELVNPVYEMCVNLGCLVLGEKGGVRVFPLRPLVKGKDRKGGEGNEKKDKSLTNGTIDVSMNKKETKLRTLKIKQNTRDYSYFMNFGGDENPLSAVSIHPFSKKTILVLDSTGDLHFFGLQKNSGEFLSSSKLKLNMKVQLLAVLPNLSSKTQIFWASSNGGYLLNMISASDENKLASFDISGRETLFVGERIKDIVPISSNTILILTQGNLYVYGTD